MYVWAGDLFAKLLKKALNVINTKDGISQSCSILVVLNVLLSFKFCTIKNCGRF